MCVFRGWGLSEEGFTEEVEKGEVYFYDFGVVFVVLHFRTPAFIAGVIPLTNIVEKQSLEIPLSIENAYYGLRFEYLKPDELPY